MNSPVRIEGVAHGGGGIARPDGKATFVAGAVPGDVVELTVVESRARYDRAVVAKLIEPSPDRIEPPCPAFGDCGGCSWQMVDVGVQREWKHQLVASQLEHLGGVGVEVQPVIAAGDPFRYRNRIDLRTSVGSWALIAAGTHEPVAIEDCLLVVDTIRHLMESIKPSAKQKVTIRAGVATGESVAIGHGPGLVSPRSALIHEQVAGKVFRISGRAFFQVNTAGAEILVQLVESALEGAHPGRLLDGYAGGGLFAATAGQAFSHVLVVEENRTALGDLRHNAPDAELVAGPMEQALVRVDRAVDAVVVDPPREGLGAAVVAQIARLSPAVVASVSCDPASAARDTRLLIDAGYRLDWIQPVDLFPQTPHIETVSRFTR